MSGTKLLITGLANTGKTTLLKDLTDAVVFSYDNKPFPFDIPHRNITEADKVQTAEGFTTEVTNLISAYKKKFGKLPETLAIDSISTIVGAVDNYCTNNYQGFNQWSSYKMTVESMNTLLNNLASKGMNIVLITHVHYNNQNDCWEDTTKGSFSSKTGGFIATVDYAVNIELTKNNERIVYCNNSYRISRSTQGFLQNNTKYNEPIDVNNFSLQEYLTAITNYNNTLKDNQI